LQTGRLVCKLGDWFANWATGLQTGRLVCKLGDWFANWATGLQTGRLVCKLGDWFANWATGLATRWADTGQRAALTSSDSWTLLRPAAPLNSRPLSDCKMAGAPIMVKMSSRAKATATARLLYRPPLGPSWHFVGPTRGRLGPTGGDSRGRLGARRAHSLGRVGAREADSRRGGWRLGAASRPGRVPLGGASGSSPLPCAPPLPVRPLPMSCQGSGC
jgi:hypothetical protein